MESKLNDLHFFVKNLELPPVPEVLEGSFAEHGVDRKDSGSVFDHKDSGSVVDGSLVSFTNSLSGEDKQDVLDSTLLAQLAANKKFDREKQTDQWYSYYKHVLENIGWIVQDFQFIKYQSTGATFTMDEAALELLAEIAGGTQMGVMGRTIEALKKLPKHDNRVVLFNRQSDKVNAGNFQLLTCTKDASGQITTAIGAFHFFYNEKVTRFLFWQFDSSKIKLYRGAQTCTLNSEVYAKVRSQIQKKLGVRAQNFVKGLEI